MMQQKRRSASDLGAHAGMQFSSALSSIQKSHEAGEGARGGYVAFFTENARLRRYLHGELFVALNSRGSDLLNDRTTTYIGCST
jgi:hypothetical protein